MVFTEVCLVREECLVSLGADDTEDFFAFAADNFWRLKLATRGFPRKTTENLLIRVANRHRFSIRADPHLQKLHLKKN